MRIVLQCILFLNERPVIVRWSLVSSTSLQPEAVVVDRDIITSVQPNDLITKGGHIENIRDIIKESSARKYHILLIFLGRINGSDHRFFKRIDNIQPSNAPLTGYAYVATRKHALVKGTIIPTASDRTAIAPYSIKCASRSINKIELTNEMHSDATKEKITELAALPIRNPIQVIRLARKTGNIWASKKSLITQVTEVIINGSKGILATINCTKDHAQASDVVVIDNLSTKLIKHESSRTVSLSRILSNPIISTDFTPIGILALSVGRTSTPSYFPELLETQSLLLHLNCQGFHIYCSVLELKRVKIRLISSCAQGFNIMGMGGI